MITRRQMEAWLKDPYGDAQMFLLQQRFGIEPNEHTARMNPWQMMKDWGAKAIGRDQADLAAALEARDPRYMALLRGTPYEQDPAALVHAWGANRSRIPRKIREGIEQLWQEGRRMAGEKAKTPEGAKKLYEQYLKGLADPSKTTKKPQDFYEKPAEGESREGEKSKTEPPPKAEQSKEHAARQRKLNEFNSGYSRDEFMRNFGYDKSPGNAEHLAFTDAVSDLKYRRFSNRKEWDAAVAKVDKTWKALESKAAEIKSKAKTAFNSLEKSWMGHSSFAPMRHADDDDDLTELEQVWWLGNDPSEVP